MQAAGDSNIRCLFAVKVATFMGEVVTNVIVLYDFVALIKTVLVLLPFVVAIVAKMFRSLGCLCDCLLAATDGHNEANITTLPNNAGDLRDRAIWRIERFSIFWALAHDAIVFSIAVAICEPTSCHDGIGRGTLTMAASGASLVFSFGYLFSNLRRNNSEGSAALVLVCLLLLSRQAGAAATDGENIQTVPIPEEIGFAPMTGMRSEPQQDDEREEGRVSDSLEDSRRNICPICLDVIVERPTSETGDSIDESTTTLSCRHAFHTACIDRWSGGGSSERCPYRCTETTTGIDRE